MRELWKFTQAMVLAVGFILVSDAHAADITISTGYDGGSYHGVFGRNLGKILSERGHSVTLMPSKGSVENLERVSAGEAQVGFAQADAYAATRSDAEIIGSLGQECLFVAASESSGIDDEAELQASGVKIAVGQQGSGSAVSWDYARELEPDYMEASTFYQGGILALSKVKTGQLDAFFWVTTPGNLDHKYLKAVRTEGSGLRMIDFNDWDMNDELPNGEAVYEFKDVEVEAGMFADSVEVPCTQVLVVAYGGMDSAAIEDLATAVMMNANRITGQ